MFLVRKLKLNPIQAVNYTSNTKDTKAVCVQNDEAESIYDFPETWSKVEENPIERTNFEEHSTVNETDKCLLLNPNQDDGFNFIDTSMFSEDVYNLNDSEDSQLQETIIEINLGLSDFMFENFQDMPEIK
ncbi:uncharacterized protein LOC106662883 isoform X2 [Cimex lectularius]|uniref:Uncharacterized protein n=1 Tax=Cimex lectularius TaxID=79782 RepID=A0A8I6RIN3_CIMLE|nr:uncharacterized protein LOC106662883 isoform X2 [Cimex lectularius]